MKRMFIILSLFLYCLDVFGQRFSHYGIESGLPCSFVVDVAVDKYDRVWVATDNGLSLYDGTRFTTYTTHNSPISANGLNALQYDEDTDILWVVTKNRVSAINCGTHQFLDLEEPSATGFQFLAKASDGGIWASCRGDFLGKYNNEGTLIEQYTGEDLLGIPGSFISIYDDNGRLYIGSVFDGMSIVDLKKNEVKRYIHDEKDIHSLPGDQVYDFCRDHYGRLWVGTDHGLALFDESTGSFFNFKHDPDDDTSLIADHIYSLEELDGGELWISTDIGGISVLPLQNINVSNLDNVSFRNIEVTNDDYGLSSSNIRKVVEDRYGNHWIANYGSGLSCLQHSDARFKKIMEAQYDDIAFHKSVRGLFYDNENHELWAGTDNEVIVFDQNYKLVRTYNLSDNLVRPNGKVYCISKYQEKYYFGVRDNGLLELDPKNNRIKRIEFGHYVDVNAIYPDGDVLWIGSQVGVFYYKDGEIHEQPMISQRIGYSSIFGFYRAKNNNFWVNTFGYGVHIFDADYNFIKTPSIKKNEISGDICCNLIADRYSNIWVATQHGITKFIQGDWVQKEFIGFDNGLQDEMVHAIAEDDFGNIWIGSDRGISCYNPSTKEIQNYSYKDGIPYGNIQHSSVTKDNAGNIYFGTHNGICVFSPKSLLAEEKCSDIHIQEYSFEGDEHHFSFCVADEAQRDIVDYYYRIKGLSDEWTNIGDQTSVSFHGLASGNYTFEVKAMLRNVKDSGTNVESRSFYVAPPFWKSWWASILYAFVLVLITIFIFRSYRNRILLRSSLEIARRNNINEQHLNRERLKFFTNITHELRTPLTLIIGPLEDMKVDKSLPSSLLKKVEVMHSNAAQLLHLVNEILEFRKTETENRQLTVEQCRLSDIVKETWIRFKESNRNDAVNFVMDITEHDEPIWADTNAIKTILNNLLSNSIKYTPKGEIGVSLRVKNDNAVIKVFDTGYGISTKDLPHIYDRYYQPDNEHQQTGTGIGLAVVKALAELHKAKLEVESKEGEGTTFCLSLNVNEIYPDAIHKEAAVIEESKSDVFVEDNDSEVTDSIILVVEDNEDIRDYIANSFDGKYKTVLSTDGMDGLAKAHELLPDIIISDIMMPRMDGITMCKKLKNDINTSHIPIVLLTAKDTLENQAEGYETGADAYLTKPFSARLLAACVQSQLDQMSRVSKYLSNNMAAGHISLQESATDMPHINKIDAEFIEKLNAVIQSHISDSELSVNDICTYLGFSHSTLYRKVKALTDLSINEYIRRQRLLKAKELLISSGHNVSEVAFMCGFVDLGYFITCFKKEFGTTPSTFIKKS